jgi:hypothetical protein
MLQSLSKLIRYIVNDFYPWLFFASGVGMYVFTPECPETPLLASIFIGAGLFLLWLHRKQGSIDALWRCVWRKILGEVAEVPIDKLSPEKQLAVRLRLVFIFSLVSVPAEAFILYDLLQLESHAVESVRAWAPIAFLYELFGFWPAVLFIPSFFGIVIIILSMKLFHQRRQSPPAA